MSRPGATRLVIGASALFLGAWLLFLSRWVVDHIVSGEHDSNPIVYIVYGAWTWIPGLVLLAWGVRMLATRDR